MRTTLSTARPAAASSAAMKAATPEPIDSSHSCNFFRIDEQANKWVIHASSAGWSGNEGPAAHDGAAHAAMAWCVFQPIVDAISG